MVEIRVLPMIQLLSTIVAARRQNVSVVDEALGWIDAHSSLIALQLSNTRGATTVSTLRIGVSFLTLLSTVASCSPAAPVVSSITTGMECVFGATDVPSGSCCCCCTVCPL